MELKEDDFTLHQCTNQLSYIFLDNYNPHEMIKQILKNQENAEKYDKIIDEYNARWKSVVIVERLKKLKDHPDSNISSLVREVLGEKK